jgi:predicted RNA-binding Zn ribbon-like protein
MDAVVTVAVRLVNTLTAGEAHGRPYAPPQGAALLAAVSAALRIDPRVQPRVSGREAAELSKVAQALRAVFVSFASGDVDAAAWQVNTMLAETGARPQLDRHDGEPWHVHFHGAEESLAKGYAAGCATGLAIVLGSEARDRLGICTAPQCDRVYVDTSRNGTRRFCSTSCQNRVKAAAFRSRRVSPRPRGDDPPSKSASRASSAPRSQPKNSSASA